MNKQIQVGLEKTKALRPHSAGIASVKIEQQGGLRARYLVAKALGLADDVRNERATFPLETEDGMKIEVKCFSPFQSRPRGRLQLSSEIRPAQSGNKATAEFDQEIEHQTDVYVLCVLGDREADRSTIDPLNLDQWDFYLMKASLLDEESAAQKTNGAANLNEPGLIQVTYAELGSRIRDLSPGHRTQRTLESPNHYRATRSARGVSPSEPCLAIGSSR